MIIDAMDLLYTGNLDGFCLVTSDSDFTKLASRLRESGKTVYGFGEPRTPQSLVAACDKFVYLDVLRRPEKPKEPTEGDASATAPTRKSSSELRGDTKLIRWLREGIDAASDDDGWANLGGVGSHITKQAPDFDSRNWGYAKLVDLVTAIELFEVKHPLAKGFVCRERPKGAASKKAAAKSGTGQKDMSQARCRPRRHPARHHPSTSWSTGPRGHGPSTFLTVATRAISAEAGSGLLAPS